MSLNALKKSFKGVTTAATVTLASFGVNAANNNNDVIPASYKAPVSTTAFDALKHAMDYSLITENVGIVLHYGPGDGVAPLSVFSKGYVGEFNKKSADTNYFINLGDKPGISVTYVACDVSIGPMGIKEAIARVPEAISLNEGAQKSESCTTLKKERSSDLVALAMR